MLTLSMGTIIGLPKLNLKWLKVPPQLIAIGLCSIIATQLQLPVKTLADLAGKSEFTGGFSALPKLVPFGALNLNQGVLSAIVTTALGVALVSIIEMILSKRVSETLTGTTANQNKGTDRSIIGLGFGNLIAACFGGFGGCGLIPHTILNIKSGGRTWLSSFSFSVFTAMSVVFGAPILGKIPMSALAGLMVMVAYNTFEWDSTKEYLKTSFSSLEGFFNSLALLVTMYISYGIDMGLAVFVGTILTKIPFLFKKEQKPADQVTL
jgi:sulfate permease, SulP family